jgi:hypothetical protein
VTRLQQQKGGSTNYHSAFCEMAQEARHWARKHPEAAKREEDHARFHKCNQEHAKEMNGTPQQFWAALDRCLNESHGVVTPKKKTKATVTHD